MAEIPKTQTEEVKNEGLETQGKLNNALSEKAEDGLLNEARQDTSNALKGLDKQVEEEGTKEKLKVVHYPGSTGKGGFAGNKEQMVV